MKRTTVCSLFATLILIALIGCGYDSRSSDPTDWDPSSYDAVNTLDGLELKVKERTISPTGLTLEIENKTNNDYTYGEPYVLEKKHNGNWYEVPVIIEDYGFNDIGYYAAANDIIEMKVDWEWLYGKLEDGEYRIVKYVLYVREPGDYDTHHLAAEFILE